MKLVQVFFLMMTGLKSAECCGMLFDDDEESSEDDRGGPSGSQGGALPERSASIFDAFR